MAQREQLRRCSTSFPKKAEEGVPYETVLKGNLVNFKDKIPESADVVILG